MRPEAIISVFWMLSFKPTFSLSSFTSIKRLFSFSSRSAIRVLSSAYLRLLIFLPANVTNHTSQERGLHFHITIKAILFKWDEILIWGSKGRFSFFQSFCLAFLVICPKLKRVEWITQVVLVIKESICQCRKHSRDAGLIPGLGRYPGEEGNCNILQYSCLDNPMDRRAWWATVHSVTRSWTQLSTNAHTQGAGSLQLRTKTSNPKCQMH